MASLRKSVLITGCSAGGIGAALAEVFREKGYRVFATVRNPSKIPQTLSSATNVTVLKLDVLSSESIAAAVESVTKETGGTLDVLINNSGESKMLPALDQPLEEGKKIFDINFWAPFAMLQAFVPLLIAAKGCLVNNSSASAVSPLAFGSAYNGSKAALAVASETWRHELKPLGVRTITLITCAVKTGSFHRHEQPKLPESSYYSDIRDFFNSINDGRLQDGAISPRQYATKVVREIEWGSVGQVWVGTSAPLLQFLWRFSPQWVFVSITSPRV
ncbi:short-chain dehydrogenase/reductase [Hypomontagnella monticulosa]|nr:short-chain dehydrogenase/reductase [Hypomontagnella monticulosa]